jgi:serpin B
VATLHAVRNHIDTSLANPPPPASDDATAEPFTIRPANSVWGQGGYPFLDEYLQVLATNYGAGLRLVDYVGDPEGSRQIINEWVELATEDRIKDLIPEGGITDLTRLTLVNAIWFKASWASPFDPAATAPGLFTLLDGSEAEVPLMRTFLKTSYAEDRRFEAVRLPYAGDAAMVVLLPKDGSPAELAASLSASGLDFVWEPATVALTMPSFEFEGDVKLNEPLKELGMPTAFEPPFIPSPDLADFSGINGFQELYISGAFHKTFIAADEEGTEAAAATAIVLSIPVSGSIDQSRHVVFTADRPFLFWIEHSSTGEMLFLGQVTNPT